MRTLFFFSLTILASAGSAQPFVELFSAQDINATFQAVAVDGGRNVYIAGVEDGNFFARRLDQNGFEIWSTALSTANVADVDSLVVDNDGNIHMSGRTDVSGATAKIFLASFNRTDGSVRYTKSIPNITSQLAPVRIAAARSGNSVLLYVAATFVGSTTGLDALALRINPATGAEVWRRQIDGGASAVDFGLDIFTNATGSPFLNARLSRPTGVVGTLLRLSGTDGTTIFQRDLGRGSVRNGMVSIKGTNNIGFLGVPVGANDTLFALINGSTGAVIRQSEIADSPVGGFSSKSGDMVAGLLNLGVARMSGSTGLFATMSVGEQIQRVLCIDGADQLIHAPTIVGGGGGLLRRGPAVAEILIAFAPRAAVVDNLNNIVLIGTIGGVSHILKLSQALDANADTIVQPFSTTLTALAPGVLVNDAGFGATLAIEQQPTKGTVVLSQDGSFVYTPGPQFIATDSFSYRLTKGAETDVASVTVRRTSFESLSLNLSGIVGGQNVNGIVRMTQTPTVGLEALISDNSTAITVPASVSVSTSGLITSFPISSIPVSSSFSVTLTATVAGVTKQATLLINPGGLKALTLNAGSSTVVAGDSRSIKVETTGISSSKTVAITGSGPEATFPASVVVPAGATSTFFVLSVPQRTTPASFTLTAKLFETTKSLTISIEPMSKIATLAAPQVVVGGLPITFTVTLDKPTPYLLFGTTLLTLNPGNVASISGGFVVGIGNTTGIFQAQTQVTTASKVFTVQATVGGASKSRNVQVIPSPLLSIVASPSSVTGGQPLSVTVNLNNLAPTGGLAVGLSSSSVLVSIPSSVVVSAGSWAATVPATTRTVASPRLVTLTATLSNVTKTAVVTLTP